MKTSFTKLFSTISLSVVLAGGLLSTAEAQKVTITKKPLERSATINKGSEIEFGVQHYKPSTTPWADERPATSTVSGQLGKATGGVDLQALETRAGTFVNQGENALSVGAAGQAHLVRVTVGGTASTDTVKAQGRDIVANTAKGTAEMYIGARGVAETGVDFGKDPTLKATVGGFAGQNISANGDVRTQILGGGVGVNGSASVGVGAEGSAGMNFNKEGGKIGVGGFAGDSATATGGFDVMGVGGAATATGYAGVGAELSGGGSYEGGKVKIKGTAGAALGLGGKVSIDLTVDVSKAEEEGKAFADNVEHFGKQGVEIVDREVKQAGAVMERDLKKFGNDTKAVFEQQIPQAFNRAGKEVETGATKAGNDVKNFFEKDVKNSFTSAGQSIDSEAKKAGQQIDQGFKSMGSDIDKGVKNLFKW